MLEDEVEEGDGEEGERTGEVGGGRGVVIGQVERVCECSRVDPRVTVSGVCSIETKSESRNQRGTTLACSFSIAFLCLILT